MQTSKWAWLIIGNAVLGLFTCYLYIFLWVAYAFEEDHSIFSWFTLTSAFIGGLVFLIWNFFFIRKYSMNYWLHSIFTYVGTVSLFIFLFQFVEM